MWRVCVYIIVLVICSLSGVQGQNRINPTEEEVVHLWAEYLELVLPDYYMITSQNFPDTEKNEGMKQDRFIEGIWCLHYMNPFYGTFYYPNGTKVVVFTGTFSFDRTTNTYIGPDPIFQTDEQLTHTVLLRDTDSTTPITSDYEGLYKCIIDDRTLVVGVYDTSTYNDNTGPKAGDMSLSLISTPRYVDPPVFNLSFTVTNGPPTDVTCTGPNLFSITQTSDDLSREIVNNGTATLVTVTVRTREGGNYQCTVSNARVDVGEIGGVTATEGSSSLTVTVSDTPTDLTLTRLGTGLDHVQLSWTGSSHRYEVFYSLSGSDNIQSLVNTTHTTYTTSGLTQGQTYEFFVVSDGNDGPVLPSAKSTIKSMTLTLPSVSDFTATSTSNTITLTWTKPAPIPSNGYTATLQCRRLCEVSLDNGVEETSSSSPLVFSGINPGSYCTISLIGLYGDDIYTPASGFATTLSTAPISPPENIICSSVEARSLNVSWDEVPCSEQNGPIAGYLLYYTNTTFYDTINIARGENRSYTLTELRPYTNYTVTVSAYNDAGTGPTSDNRIQQTKQAKPTSPPENIIFSSVQARSMNISWDEVPHSRQNGPITGYLLYYTNTIYSDTINITGGKNRSYILTELRPYTNYTVTVSAYNDVGTGPTSDNKTQQTQQAKPTSPPANIIFSSVETRSINISWDEVPDSRQNGPITGYLLYYTNTTFSDTINITGGENRSFTLTELRPYTNYTVTVSAYNDVGTGPTSDNRIQRTERATAQLFQLRIGRTHDCATWSLDELNLIQTDIKIAIIDTITSQCDCHFNEFAITEDEFTCRYSNSYFTYRVKIAVHSRTFPLAAEEYVNHIRNWVKSGRASFLSERRRLWIDESCDINITSFTDPECRPGNIIKS